MGKEKHCGSKFAAVPSGIALDAGTTSDWAPVILTKTAPKGKAAKSSSAVNVARRSGAEVETTQKVNAGGNKSAHSQVPNAAKLDENGETFRHATVSHDFKMALQQARLAKKMSQAQLTTAINEKGTVINEYESGKAIPNGAIINKLNRALGVRLPKAKG